MSDPWETIWSDNPNAPQIPLPLYLDEKEYFAGFLICPILYGIIVALFFQCMTVLLSPPNPMKRGTKWALVAHTVAMFTFYTISLGIFVNDFSIQYINNREFPGNGEFPPGPLGYSYVLDTDATTMVYNLMFPLNQWLGDGLLLHHCYVIYSMDYWVMAFLCLMYLASVGCGIVYAYEGFGSRAATVTSVNITTSYLSICLALNVLLTLMIVVRLLRHVRNVRAATGGSGGSGGLRTTVSTVVTMIIESYALYAVALLMCIVPWVVNSWLYFIFSIATGEMQVIAPYLIILRVAKRRAMTTNSTPVIVDSIRFRSQGTTDGDGSLPDRDPTDVMVVNREALMPGAGADDTIEEAAL